MTSPARSARPSPGTHGYSIRVASELDRDAIYQLRHEVYAEEIGQHPVQESGRLCDGLDQENLYITAWHSGNLAGFVSLTPPQASRYSLEKYFNGCELPFKLDEHTFEVRLLTVRKGNRGGSLSALLMYAALRWVEAQAGTRIVGIGRREILSMYRETGLETTGLQVQSGLVTYEFMSGTAESLRRTAQRKMKLLMRTQTTLDWQLPMAFEKPAPCFHGGAFFDAVGANFASLERSREIINADVLDAWFDPAPAVLSSLHDYLPWLLRTSPPTSCEGLVHAIASARNVATENILVGAGSSDLIFRTLPFWLNRGSRVLILDPTYGEYAHILEQVIGCAVDRISLRREHGYALSVEALRSALEKNYDLFILVNPNSPTGIHISADTLQTALQSAPRSTRVWIDETYIDYSGPNQSLERFAVSSPNIVVCKSISKAYALSGARVAYLCASAPLLEPLRALTPPWVVSLPAQVAAVKALESLPYYTARWQETALLRRELAQALRHFGWDVIEGVANFLLCHLPCDGPSAHEVTVQCREHGLYLRDASPMGQNLGCHAIRLAVKDAPTNLKMVQILSTVLQQSNTRSA